MGSWLQLIFKIKITIGKKSIFVPRLSFVFLLKEIVNIYYTNNVFLTTPFSKISLDFIRERPLNS